MATPAQKRAAAVKAMQALAKTNPDLAGRIADDFVNSGFTYSSQLQGDVAEAYAVNPSIGAALKTFFSDPVAMRQEGQAVLSQIGSSVGSVIGRGAGATAKAGQNIAAATGAGLASTFSGPLGPLFQAHIWIRVGEVALGLILIAVGVAKLTNAVPVATKIAKAVA